MPGVETQYFASPRSRIEPQPMPGDAKYCVSTLPHRTRIHTRYRIEPEPDPHALPHPTRTQPNPNPIQNPT